MVNASSSNQKPDFGIVPKVEVEDLTYDSPPHHTPSSIRMIGDNPSSSSSSMRSSVIGMGFAPSLVDRAIKENGEGNIDLILETLFTYAALQIPNSDHSDSVDGLSDNGNEPQTESATRKALQTSSSSDSLDNLFSVNEETCSHSNYNPDAVVKEEPDVTSVLSEKRASLIGMSFSKVEVESAINKLGVDAPINDLVDFIFAAQMAEKYEKGACDPSHNNATNVQQCSTEALFGIMEKTLKLFDMGFSEEQISIAIDKCGSEVPISELAAAILGVDDVHIKMEQYFPSSSSVNNSIGGNYSSTDAFSVKAEAEECNSDNIPTGDFDFLEKLKGKRPKEKDVEESLPLKRPKEEYEQELSISGVPTWLQDRPRNSASLGSSLHNQRGRKKVHIEKLQTTVGATKMIMPKSCKTHDKMVAEPPYFFYGSAANSSHGSWFKISQFLYSIQPEFANTESFSAISRKEGYVHNLPIENRFHLLPKPPMTFGEALPRATKWWPSWDTRKHLKCISCDTNEASQACERIGRSLENSRGVVSATKQAELVQQFQALNLVWVGENKLAPIQVEDLERILGYPVNHTRCGGLSREERLKLLKNSFQVETLAFHLSALKSIFPNGLSLLSVYTGIGGAEVALHRLGIRFKAVVSVEPLETNRRIFKYWWEKEAIAGELVQMDNIQSRPGTTKLEGLIKKYNGFDIVIGQNQPTPSNPMGIDLQLFYEFVRCVQRVRSAMGKSR